MWWLCWGGRERSELRRPRPIYFLEFLVFFRLRVYSSHPWASLTDVEIATLQWVHWWNNERLHEAIGYRTAADIVDMYNQTRVSSLSPYKKRNKTRYASVLVKEETECLNLHESWGLM